MREKGICAESIEEFEQEAFLLDLSADECQFVGQVVDFLQEQCDKTTDVEAVLGSTEILESFFGKFKNMEGDQCRLVSSTSQPALGSSWPLMHTLGLSMMKPSRQPSRRSNGKRWIFGSKRTSARPYNQHGGSLQPRRNGFSIKH